VLAQPASGVALVWAIGYALVEPWIIASLVLYAAVGMCWLPVVAIQLRLRNLAAARTAAPLPEEYHRLFRIWLALGFPAFAGVIAIFALMIGRPQLW